MTEKFYIIKIGEMYFEHYWLNIGSIGLTGKLSKSHRFRTYDEAKRIYDTLIYWKIPAQIGTITHTFELDNTK